MTMRLHYALAVLVPALLFGCGEELTVAQHIEAAQNQMAQGEPKAATIELKNALQKEPTNPTARLLLGQAHFRLGDLLGAEKELRRAGDLGAPYAELAPTLSMTLLALGKFDELMALESDGLPLAGQVVVLTSQGSAELARGNQDRALALIDAALAGQPDSVAALMAKARYFSVRAELTLAREQLDLVFAIEPENHAAWTQLGDIELRQQHLEQAETAYTKAIEHAQNASDAHLKRAFVRLQMGNYPAAQEDLDILMAQVPQHPGVNYAQGLVHFYGENFEDAVTHFSIAERDVSRYPMALLFAGTAHYMLGSRDQAQDYASRFYAVAPENVAGSKLLATILLSAGETERVEELMRPVLARYPEDVAALNLLANALMGLGKTAEAIELLNKVAALQPDSSQAQIRLGAGLLLGGEQGGGVEKLETALELNPEFQQADILLILNYVQQQDFDNAIAAAEAYKVRNPVSPTPYNLLGRVLVAAGRPEDARAAFAMALELEPGDAGALQNLAEMAVAEKDYPAAREYYGQLLAQRPNYLRALLKLAELDALEDDQPGMLARLEQAMEAHPTALEPRVIMARYSLATKHPERVAVLFSDLEEAKKNVPAVLNLMALSQLALKDYAAAKFTLERLIQSQPDSASVRHQMAMAQAGLNDAEQLRIELEKAIELAPDYLPSRLALARLLLSQGDVKSAAPHVEKLREIAPDYPDVLLLQAGIARLEGNQDEALRVTKLAYEKLPTTNTMLSYAKQLHMAGKPDAGYELLQQWVKENSKDVIARLALAEWHTERNEQNGALEQYRAVLEVDDANMIALNNLAWYLQDSDPAGAVKYAQRASGVNPDSADVLDTLALALMKNGDTRKAQRTIERALQIAPDQPTMRYHSGMIAAAAGDMSAARKVLAALLDSGVDFPERAEAEKLLREL